MNYQTNRLNLQINPLVGLFLEMVRAYKELVLLLLEVEDLKLTSLNQLKCKGGK